MSNEILWIKPRMPGLVSDGSSLVSLGLASCFRGAEPIDLVCCRLTGREEQHSLTKAHPYRHVHVVDPDNAGSAMRRAAYRIGYDLCSLVTGTPRPVYYDSGRRMRALVGQIVQQSPPRRLVAEYYTVARLLEPMRERATLILHDADHVTLEQAAIRLGRSVRAVEMNHCAAQLRKYIPRVVAGVDRVLTLTEFDAAAYRDLGIQRVESLAVPMPDLPENRPALEEPTLVFLGTVDYPPNRDAIAWFLTDIFPAVLRKFPRARLTVIGGGDWEQPSPLPRTANVDIAGRLPPDEFVRRLQSASVGIAPLRLGTGIKVKVLDMLWHGLPVVCTAAAARGTAAELPGCASVIDTPLGFAEAICELLNSRQRRLELRDAALEAMRCRHASPGARARVRAQILGVEPATPPGTSPHSSV